MTKHLRQTYPRIILSNLDDNPIKTEVGAIFDGLCKVWKQVTQWFWRFRVTRQGYKSAHKWRMVTTGCYAFLCIAIKSCILNIIQRLFIFMSCIYIQNTECQIYTLYLVCISTNYCQCILFNTSNCQIYAISCICVCPPTTAK